ncbi:MAG TPA: SAM-dependent methyltransferase, partial [Planctomycetota bacterium]|nr:SAM-dependent methyltransferase [Planctomycetota bacterium]
PAWFRAVWKLADSVRRILLRLPDPLRLEACDGIALTAYWPLARTARWLERVGIRAVHFPLYNYRSVSLYTLRTDALDRFGTRLEHRFTADDIRSLMLEAGLERIEFSPGPVYWCAIGYRKPCSE